MAKIKLMIDLDVRDSVTGKLERHIRRASHSFDLQFLQMLEIALTHSYSVSGAIVTIQDISGTGRANQVVATEDVSSFFAVFAASNNGAYGIVVGTGSNPTSPSDTALQTIIATGSGAGQLNYGAHSKVTSAINGSQVNLAIIRTFANGSGATINVTELGIYHDCADNVSSHVYCLVRDLITSVPVPNGKVLTVTYTFTTTN